MVYRHTTYNYMDPGYIFVRVRQDSYLHTNIRSIYWGRLEYLKYNLRILQSYYHLRIPHIAYYLLLLLLFHDECDKGQDNVPFHELKSKCCENPHV